MIYNKDLQELVKERISLMPNNIKISIGNLGFFDKKQILESIQKENVVGKEVIKMQMNFIKALTSNKFTETLTNK